jgi:tetratricopeptide (TPR) repeat protein
MNEDDLKLELKAAIEIFVEDVTPIDVTTGFMSAFLEITKNIELPKEERLRQLAIAIEREEIVDGWKGLLKIYEVALQENPTGVKVFRSIGVSAIEWCNDWRESDLSKRNRATLDGKEAISKGLKISPKDGDLSHVMELLYYEEHYESEAEKLKNTETAYQWFCRAAENNAVESAKLHRAHCLHDLHRWDAAIIAYESVNQKLLAEQLHPWRVYKLREQIAYCYAQAGQHEKALTLCHKFIDGILAMNDEMRKDVVMNLDELVESATKLLKNEHLISRTRKLIHLVDQTFLYEDKI